MNTIVKKSVICFIVVAASCLSVNLVSFAAGKDDGFVHVSGAGLQVTGVQEPIYLRGVDFTNNYWGTQEDILNPVYRTKDDYERIQLMGMNVVRFSMSYAAFENDKNPYQYNQAAWNWLDRNIAWAKENNIYLILDMHIPQGGDWLDSTHKGDFSLWTSQSKQKRFKALWLEIARRYADEATIAGYDILNEPITADKNGATWPKLAKETATAIRSVDANHMLVVERLYGCNKSWEIPEDVDPQFLIDDDNVMYDFHFYYPIEYSHQYADWVDGLGEGGVWPDNSLAVLPEGMEWNESIDDNPNVPVSDSDWQYYEGVLYCPQDSKSVIGMPVLYSEANSGTVWFDNFAVNEYDASGIFLQTLSSENIISDKGWNWWSENNKGKFGVDRQVGYDDNVSLYIGKVKKAAAWSNESLAFPVTPGHYYQISGYMKGSSVAKKSNCHFSIDFYTDPSGKGILRRNKDYLAALLDEWARFGKENNVPINIGEFGLIHYCYENERGGLAWTEDMLDLMIERDINFTYWDYHSDTMGIYLGDSNYPAEEAIPNAGLIQLFKEKLK